MADFNLTLNHTQISCLLSGLDMLESNYNKVLRGFGNDWTVRHTADTGIAKIWEIRRTIDRQTGIRY